LRQDEAVRHGREVLEMLIEGAREEGKFLPAPRLFARIA
jgi:predicted RNase H-like HicB family nuclease